MEGLLPPIDNSITVSSSSSSSSSGNINNSNNNNNNNNSTFPSFLLSIAFTAGFAEVA